MACGFPYRTTKIANILLPGVGRCMMKRKKVSSCQANLVGRLSRLRRHPSACNAGNRRLLFPTNAAKTVYSNMLEEVPPLLHDIISDSVGCYRPFGSHIRLAIYKPTGTATAESKINSLTVS
jgi:hypothetical protein